ncbi:MAG: TetR/AcrR family transcriptional regulator [Acidobacteria bacterium]|nr:TetR/AcrR family transcriptional regulator [Acidobacteriota bacterium]
MNASPGAGTADGRRVRGARTRGQILRFAVDLASAEGLEGLTIGRLAGALRLSKSGLFAHFGSKEELQLATVEAAKDIFLQKVVEPALVAPPGLARLRALLEAWTWYVESSVFRGGCFFAAASAEFDGRPGAVRDRVAALTKSWLGALEQEAHRAQRRGHIQPGVDCGQLAFEAHALVQEANWACQLLGDKHAFHRARRGWEQRLRSAATPSGYGLLLKASSARPLPQPARKSKSRRRK